MRSYFLLIGILLLGFQVKAHKNRNLLQSEASMNELSQVLLDKSEWIKYPEYSDRAEWNKLLGKHKEELIKQGEITLSYQWKVITATNYLEFDKSGSRDIMQKPFFENISRLEALIMAELAEGKGRFTPKIADGVWHACEMTSWALSAHVNRAQTEDTALPSFRHHIIDLTAGDLGSLLSWTYYFFHEEFDKIQPLISQRLYTNLDERIIKPYVNRSDFWWQAFNLKPGSMVNNWNPWCNFNVLSCLLLIEDDKDDLVEGVYRTMQSVDEFINYTKEDGACEEGPSYWGHAAGKMFDYLDLLKKATGGEISIFDQAIIKNMGEYIANSYVGDSWVVNFADASAKSSGGSMIGTIFRFGMAVKSQKVKQFAAHLNDRNDKSNYHAGRDIYRSLENLMTEPLLLETDTSISNENFTWYPQTEFCYMRNQNGILVATKGGYNNESHNHNDMGTFSMFVENTPMIIDIGVGTYTRKTFSSERYSIWTMQSNYHNLPLINGVAQSYGPKYRSNNVSVNKNKLSFSLDLSHAYSKNASVNSWQRTYHLFAKSKLLIEDKFVLSEIKGENQLNFMTWGQPIVEKEGVVVIQKNGKSIRLSYDPQQFKASVEAIDLKDEKLSKVWGRLVYRLSLSAKNMKMIDTYKISIEKF